jgi:hypothetical protein
MYKKCILPGLTATNSAKQVLFSRHVHAHWDLEPGTKVLWIMVIFQNLSIHLRCMIYFLLCKKSDEKWFFGLVPRNNAKACKELGVFKQSYSAHHKKHMAKVMGHATVGFAFDGDPAKGGDDILIGMHRCQAERVYLKDVRILRLPVPVYPS